MNWKFWKWDITGRKRIAALEKRISELEAEVMPQRMWMWNNSLFDRLMGIDDDKPVKLTLRDKVNRICDHLSITFEKQAARYVLKPVKKSKA